MQLLSSLLPKVLLKLGLAALRQAAAAARLRTRLLAHAAALAGDDMRRAVVQAWREAAIPSEQQAAAGATLARTLRVRQQHAQLLAWHEWAARSALQRQQLAIARGRLRRRLLSAAMQHWRCYCQQQLVRRLHAALAARWIAALTQRRAFLAWRQAAHRSMQLKAALLLGRPCSSGSGVTSTTQAPAGGRLGLEALHATAKAFEPVKAFVAEARQQLRQLRQGLRFSLWGSWAAAGTTRELPGQLQPPPAGTVESLLAHLPPSRTPKPGAALLRSPAKDQAPDRLQLPGIPVHDAAVSAACAPAAAVSAVALEPAPDPGSPPPPYNPASYASPQRQQGGRQQRQQQQGQLAGTARVAEPPETTEAALLGCREQVQRLHGELEHLEQASLGCASIILNAGPTVHSCLHLCKARLTCRLFGCPTAGVSIATATVH